MPYTHSHGKQIYGEEEKESIERVNHIYRNEESIWRGTKDVVVVEERKKKLLLKAKPRRKENGGFFLSSRNMERNRNLLRIRITKKKTSKKVLGEGDELDHNLTTTRCLWESYIRGPKCLWIRLGSRRTRRNLSLNQNGF